MATRAQSTTCKVCNKTVRYDNPTFPYCHLHVGLKRDDLSLMKRSPQYSFESNREMLYKPEKSKVSKKQMTRQALVGSSQGTGLSEKSVAHIASGWSQATSSINTKDPQDCILNRDTVVNSMRDTVDKAVRSDSSVINPHTGIALCKNSSILIPDGDLKNIQSDHKVVYSSSDNNPTVIVDALPASVLDGVVEKENIDDVFPSGSSNFTDGLTISSLYEYAGYSSINVDYMQDSETGEVLWDNSTGLGKDSPEINSQRDLLNTSPRIVFPPINRRRSPTDEDLQADKDKNNPVEDDLEKLFYEDL